VQVQGVALGRAARGPPAESAGREEARRRASLTVLRSPWPSGLGGGRPRGRPPWARGRVGV